MSCTLARVNAPANTRVASHASLYKRTPRGYAAHANKISSRVVFGGSRGGASMLSSAARSRVQVAKPGIVKVRAVLDVTDESFASEVLQSDIPVLVDFWAEWCGPCKLVSMSMDQIQKEYEGNLKVVKVETDPNPKLVEEFRVYGLPTLMIFKDGKQLPESQIEGAITKAKVITYLERYGITANVTS